MIAQGSGSEDLSEDAARVVAVIRAAGGKLACTGLRVRAALRARNVIVLANTRIEMGATRFDSERTRSAPQLALEPRRTLAERTAGFRSYPGVGPMTDLRGRLALGHLPF